MIEDGQLWVTGKQLAHRYNVSRAWVLARPRQLGAAPISDSQNSQLRYHLPTADAYLESRMRGGSGSRKATPARRSRRGARPGRSAAPRLDFV